jgi:protein SCO1
MRHNRLMSASMPVSTRTYAIAASAVAAAALLGIVITPAFRSGNDIFADCRETVVSGGNGAIGGPFSLTDEDSLPVTEKDVLQKPALVYFGYSFCPDVCPTDLARNAQAVDVLEEMGHEVTPIFISVDPARDSPAVLKEFTDALHPRMIGLTGTAAQISATAKAYKTIYRVPEAPEDMNYLVDHMTYTYLMLPSVGFAEFFASEASADEVAKRAACFIDVAGSA